MLILFLACILRFYELPNNPSGLTWDEAALGYNSYSLLQTGRDEYGTLLPLNLKSFGDWKPAFYVYLDIPFVAILGLNELAVRFPSAIFGILGVLGIYLLVNELFKKKSLALLAAFFLAISPWHIQFSRPAFEANVALTFNIFGVYFFLKGLRNKKWFIWSALVFGLSLLTYQASRLFVPLLILGLLFIFKKDYHRKNLIAPTLVIIFFLSLVGWTFLTGQTSRLATQNFFAYSRSQVEIKTITNEDGMDVNSLGFQLLHGEWWAYTKGLVERYLIYFSPKMLFTDGDYSQRHKVPDLGVLYYFSVILIPLGIVYLLKFGGAGNKIIFFWLLLASLPAVLSRDLISILRAFNMVIPWVILEAAGIWWLIEKIRGVKKYWGYMVTILIGLVIIANFLIYLDRYFVHAPKEYSNYWLYGYKQVFEDLINMDLSNKNQIVVTDIYGQPYIYYLFYTKFPPEKFQKQAQLDQPGVDVGSVRNIDNIEFRHIYWPADRGEKNSLFIGSFDELPDKDILSYPEYKILKDINFLNGLPAFRIVETQ